MSYCATCDGCSTGARPVVVVGKTHEAPGEANWLKEIGCQVTYVSEKEPQGLNQAIPFVKSAGRRSWGSRG